jgi:hypothetical protein
MNLDTHILQDFPQELLGDRIQWSKEWELVTSSTNCQK